jgi:O-antigen ligase
VKILYIIDICRSNKNQEIISNKHAFVKGEDVLQLRVYYAMVLMIVGVLYPEEKTLIAGVSWPPFIAIIGIILIFALKQKLNDGVVLSGLMILLTMSVIFFSLLLSLVGINEAPSTEFLLRHYLTLIITTIVCFLLVSDLSVSLIIKCIYRFIFGLSIMLLLLRLSLLDFTREGSFLGLGPLTFARYVCVGWIAQIYLDKRIRALPSIVFTLALILADSKGPILFLMITITILFSIGGQLNWKRTAMLVFTFGILFAVSGRFVALTSDLNALVSGELSTTNVVAFEEQTEAEAISSTLARVIAVTSSFEFIAERPLIGWGIGSWPKLTGLEYLEYPHNSILEIWFEYGIYGLAVFMFFVVRAAKGALLGNPFSFFVIYCGLLSTTTGSIKDLRVLLFFTLLTYHNISCIRKPIEALKKSVTKRKGFLYNVK